MTDLGDIDSGVAEGVGCTGRVMVEPSATPTCCHPPSNGVEYLLGEDYLMSRVELDRRRNESE